MSFNKLLLLPLTLSLLLTTSSCKSGSQAKKYIPEVAGVVGGAIAGALAEKGIASVAGDECPENVVCQDNRRFPAPGYKWFDTSDPNNFKVVWSPGLKHGEHSNVIAADKEDLWIPKTGYRWSDSDLNSSNSQELRRDDGYLDVVWYPNSSHYSYENVVAADEEGKWKTAPNYVFKYPEDPNDLTVVSKGIVRRVWIDPDVYQNGERGMQINAEFEVNGLQGVECAMAVYFYSASGKPLKDFDGDYNTTGGEVSVNKDFIPTDNSTVFEDFAIFFPYSEFHIDESGSYDLKLDVKLYEKSGDFFAESNDYGFTFER